MMTTNNEIENCKNKKNEVYLIGTRARTGDGWVVKNAIVCYRFVDFFFYANKNTI